MDTEPQEFRLEKSDIKVGRDRCSYCLTSFGTKKKMSAMVRVSDASGVKFVCEKCYREGLENGTLTKVTKLSKKEKKALKRERTRLKRRRKKQPEIIKVIRKRK